VATGLDVSPDSAAMVVTAAQLGYAAGTFLLVPLGDRLPHRPLVVALLAAGAAPALAPLLCASAQVGTATVVALILEAVMNSIRKSLGTREIEIARKPSRLWNPHFYAIFAQVHNTL